MYRPLNAVLFTFSLFAMLTPAFGAPASEGTAGDLAGLRKQAAALIKAKQLSKARPLSLQIVKLEESLHGESAVLINDLSRVVAVSCAGDRCFDALPELLRMHTIKTRLYGENYPGKPFTLQMIGEAYEKKKNYDSAEKYFRQAIVAQTKDPRGSGTLDLSLQMNLVRLYEEQSLFEDAATLCRRLLAEEKRRGLPEGNALVKATVQDYHQLLKKHGKGRR